MTPPIIPPTTITAATTITVVNVSPVSPPVD